MRTTTYLAVIALLAPLPAQQDAKAILARALERYSDADPGCVAAIAIDGELRAIGARGVIEVGKPAKLEDDSRFYIASVSKQFTAACIHILARAKKLSLEDDVRKFVPELPDYGVRITIRHLLHHRSGLRGCFELMALAKKSLDEAHTHADVLRLVCRQKQLDFEPGKEFAYSNTGYLLLAEIVQRVSGKSLREFARTKIFEPLKMSGTDYRDRPGEKIAGAALGHDRVGRSYRPHPTRFHVVGPGGVVSTARDLMRWQLALNARTFLGEDFVAGLERPAELEADDGRNPQLGPYAAGLLVSEFGGKRAVWHPGGSLGFNTCVLRFPAEKLAVVVLCNANSGNAHATAMGLAQLQLGVKFGAAPAEAAAQQPRPGRYFYRNPRTKELMLSYVSARQSKLAVAAWDIEMRGTGALTMESVNAATPILATFQLRQGAMPDLRLAIGDQTPFVCKPVAPGRFTAAQLAGVAGEWYSEEVDATLSFEVAGKKIRLADRLPFDVGPLLVINANCIASNKGLEVRVERDAAGKPAALLVSTKSVRGLRYVRR